MQPTLPLPDAQLLPPEFANRVLMASTGHAPLSETSLKFPMQPSAKDLDRAAVTVERRVVDELEISGGVN